MAEYVTLSEYAARCREVCSRAAQSDDGRMCGEVRDLDGERNFTFCGGHFALLLDGQEATDV